MEKTINAPHAPHPLTEASKETLLFILSVVFWWYCEWARRRVQQFLAMLTRRTPEKPPKSVQEPEEAETTCSELETTCPELEKKAVLDHEIVERKLSSGTAADAVFESAEKPHFDAISVVDGNVVAELDGSEDTDNIDNAAALFLPPAAPQFPRPFFPPPGLELPMPSELQELPMPSDLQVTLAPMVPTAPAVTNPPQPPSHKKHAAKTNTPKNKTSEPNPRELARCVCFKDAFGFLVDEAGSRLFVRQNDVEGDQKLIAGQVVWFRRARQPTSQTPKASDVVLVDIEMAKMLRLAEREGMSWTALREAVIRDDAEVIKKFCSLPGIKNYKSKLEVFKAEAKGLSAATVPSTKKPAAEKSEASKPAVAGKAAAKKSKKQESPEPDDDLSAFLGSGSVEEMRANLKYAPKWVVDKFQSLHGIA